MSEIAEATVNQKAAASSAWIQETRCHLSAGRSLHERQQRKKSTYL
jgi:hypothetical protein